MGFKLLIYSENSFLFLFLNKIMTPYYLTMLDLNAGWNLDTESDLILEMLEFSFLRFCIFAPFVKMRVVQAIT